MVIGQLLPTGAVCPASPSQDNSLREGSFAQVGVERCQFALDVQGELEIQRVIDSKSMTRGEGYSLAQPDEATVGDLDAKRSRSFEPRNRVFSRQSLAA